MTISSTSSRLEYTGNGVTTAFSVTFQFLLSSDLKVYQAGTLKTITTHYTVSGGSGSTGTVTFLTAPANAEEVVIVNDPPLTQTTDYVANDPFPAESHERALDKLTILIQRLKSQVDRALVLSDTTVASADFTLPSPVANKGLKWNSAADAIENTTFDIDSFALNAQTYATAAAASAAAALVSENNALTAENNAETAETNAELAEAGAEAAAQATAFNWLFDAATTMADPGAGDFRLNNAAIASVTAIAVSANSAASGSPDVSGFVDTWDNSTNATKGYLTIRKVGDPAVFATFALSQVTDNTTWLQLTVTYITGNGSLSDTNECYIAPILTGDKGVDGIGAGDMLADGTVPMTGSLVMGANTKIIFEGTTADDYETTLDPGEPTADRTITLPNASGTVLTNTDIGASVQAYDANTTKNDVANTFTAIQKWAKGADVVSANALTLGNDGNYFDITGSTSITSIGAKSIGTVIKLHFDAALTLTHHATDLILPGGANITTAAGDEAEFVEYATGDWRCTCYTKASGQAVVAASSGGITLKTPVTTTSGTAIEFDSLPAGVKRISINFSGVSTNGTSNMIVQIGDSGGFEISGYLGAGTNISSGGIGSANYTAGFGISSAEAAAVFHGTIILTLLDSTNRTWACHGGIAKSNQAIICHTAGAKSLSAELDRVRVTTSGGADTFDAGSMNITYE